MEGSPQENSRSSESPSFEAVFNKIAEGKAAVEQHKNMPHLSFSPLVPKEIASHFRSQIDGLEKRVSREHKPDDTRVFDDEYREAQWLLSYYKIEKQLAQEYPDYRELRDQLDREFAHIRKVQESAFQSLSKSTGGPLGEALREANLALVAICKQDGERLKKLKQSISHLQKQAA
jgi:hypothetical protein